MKTYLRGDFTPHECHILNDSEKEEEKKKISEQRLIELSKDLDQTLNNLPLNME
jgi:hypothetical protein